MRRSGFRPSFASVLFDRPSSIANRQLIIVILLLLPLVFCGCYQARDESLKGQFFSEIVKREHLRKIGEDGFFENALLSNPYAEVRQWSAIALGRIADPRALPLLYKALRTGDAAVRAASAFAIGEIEDRERLQERSLEPDPEAAAELRRLLNDPSLTVRMRAVEALGRIGSRAEASEIAQRLESFPYRGQPAERAYLDFSITALVRLKDAAALPVIKKLAGVRDPDICRHASDALVRLQSKAAGPSFAENMEDPNISVQSYARRSAGATGIDEDPDPSSIPIGEAFCQALADSRKNITIARLETTRGAIEIELFREEAPVTVANFVLMAEGGAYDGLEFDQAVPLHLVAGSSPSLREKFRRAIVTEVNMRPFERGSVGVALAGGYSEMGRFFIALSPQPYLDGVNTCFGRVLSGMQVADRIVRGDRITHIAIKETIGILDRHRY